MKTIQSILSVVLLLLVNSVAASVAQSEKNVTGSWLGTLDTGAIKLRVVFNISQSATGSLSATMDSPDQGARGIAVDSVTVTDTSLTMEVKAVQGGYKGTFDAAGNTVTGQWTQGPNSLPLNLTKGSAADMKSTAEVFSPADLALTKKPHKK